MSTGPEDLEHTEHLNTRTGETVRISPDEYGQGSTVSGVAEIESVLDTSDTALAHPAETPVSQPVSAADQVPTEPADDPQQTTELSSSKLRTGLVYALFAFTGLWLVINVYQSVRIGTEIVDWTAANANERVVIDSVDSAVADRLNVGDVLIAVNGEAVLRANGVRQALERLRAGETYTLRVISPDGVSVRDVTLTAPPSTAVVELNKYLVNLVIPATFFLCGLIVFIFKPDNKLVVLMAMTFALMTIAVPVLPRVMPELAFPLNVVWSVGTVMGFIFAPMIFHLHLIFPEPSRFVRRFPFVEKLLYLPCFLLTVPIAVMWQLSLNGFSDFDMTLDRPIFTQVLFLPHLSYLLGTLIVVVVNYFLTDTVGKRRIRLYAAGAALSVAPYLVDKVIRPIEYMLDLRLYNDDGFRYFLTLAPTMFLPLSLAYAITRHKVIPVSFVIRRGLQYLLARNALRLLILLPLLGIVWNLASNPNRLVPEILFQNSVGFYLSLVLMVAIFAVNHFGLREWIDRRFFRRQYDKEVLLRELGEEVQEADSLSSLSRLVSDKIDRALHPSSIYLFFRNDVSSSDFSMSYTTTGTQNHDFRIDPDSPVLRYLQAERRSIDFSDASIGDLPRAEEQWLRSLEASLLVPMHGTDRKLAGFFTLGEKRSEIPYTSGDKQLLTALANQIALIHENLTLKDRVRQEQKIRTEVLSRVDASSLNLLKECPKCSRCYDREVEQCAVDGAELTFTLPVERTIDRRYRLERLIGKGAMGAVYEAIDQRINRRVAVKILSGAMFGNRDALRRFQREAQTAGRVHHPNIVTIFDYGVLTTEGAFLVMELVRGHSLRQILDEKKTLEQPVLTDWFGQVLDGIEAAHDEGIIHRDLKPGNVLVTQTDGEPARLSVLDFGLARAQEIGGESVTVPGTILGTYGYMAPEQLRGEQADERSDLFAIAVMIYEAVHGERPFQGKNYHDLLRSMSRTDIFYQNKKWAAFFKRGLAAEPRRRYSNAAAMKQALRL